MAKASSPVSASGPGRRLSASAGGDYVHGQRLLREGDKAVVVRDDGLVQGFSMRDDRGMTTPLDEDLSAWAARAMAAMPDDASTGSLVELLSHCTTPARTQRVVVFGVGCHYESNLLQGLMSGERDPTKLYVEIAKKIQAMNA